VLLSTSSCMTYVYVVFLYIHVLLSSTKLFGKCITFPRIPWAPDDILFVFSVRGFPADSFLEYFCGKVKFILSTANSC
jgi:hypothetical protein